MDDIIEKMLQSKGVGNLMVIKGLDSCNQFYGYFDSSQSLFHICDDNLKEYNLKSIFGKRYVILKECCDCYMIENVTTKDNNDDEERDNRYLFIDTEKGNRRYVLDYKGSKNEHYVFINRPEWIYPLNSSTIDRKPFSNYDGRKKKIIINDHLIEVDEFLVLGNCDFVLTSYPYVLYDKEGCVVRSFPEGYLLLFLVTFEDGGFLFWLSKDSEDKQSDSLIYVGKTDCLHETKSIEDDLCFSKSYFYKDSVLLSFYKPYVFLEKEDLYYCLLDSKGTVESDSVEAPIIGFNNGLIVSKKDGEDYSITFYESPDNKISGRRHNQEHFALFSKHTDDPYSLNGTKDLLGLVNPEDMSILIPFFHYDRIESEEIDCWDNDSDHILMVLSIVYIEGQNGRMYCGLFKNDCLIMPISDDRIEPILYNIPNSFNNKTIFSGYYGRLTSRGWIIYHSYSDRTVEVDRFVTRSPFDCCGVPSEWVGHEEEFVVSSGYLLVMKNDASAIMIGGRIITDFKYSDAQRLNNTDWFYVNGLGRDKDKIGLVSINRGEVFPPVYDSLKKKGDYVVADNRLYSIENELLFDPGLFKVKGKIEFLFDFDEDVVNILCDNNLYDLKEQLLIDANSQGLAFVNHYSGVYCYSSTEGEFLFMDAFGDQLINGEDYYSQKGNYVFSRGNYLDLVFFKDDKSFHEVPVDDRSNDYYEEQHDYEEDTYYALGGDDYQRFKENGGSIDNMMEGMGL